MVSVQASCAIHNAEHDHQHRDRGNRKLCQRFPAILRAPTSNFPDNTHRSYWVMLVRIVTVFDNGIDFGMPGHGNSGLYEAEAVTFT